MEAYVTLVVTEAYASGALVLSHRLRDLGSKKEIVCMVTPNISGRVQDILSKVCTVIPVDALRSTDFDNLELLGRPDLDISFTKIQLWRLTQYAKLVYLDADTLPLKNIDELFDRPCFSAAPDSGWPDCFNSGVFVTKPSESTYQDLVALASKKGSFDGGDQGLLNTYFNSWPSSPLHRLPFTFNTTPTTQYGYAPAHNEYSQHISVVHFIGENKPWKYQRFADGKVLPLGNAWEGLKDMIQSWWDTWDKFYGQTSPYHLLSGDINKFDDGFQTRPIVPFDENVSNAWDNQSIDLDNDRRQVQPMPPLSTITIGQPEWLKEEAKRREEAERTRKHKEEAQQKQQYHQPEHQTYPQEHSYQEEHHHEEHHHEGHHHEEHHHEEHHHEEHHHEEHHHNAHHQEPKSYSMIEWDPARQSPPNTGSVGADIPDLSSFTNVWDQPRSEQHDVWVAPVYQPEPQIMTKPEYSQYNTQEYVPDLHGPPIHNEEHWHHHAEEHHHHQPEYHHHEHPPSFPWDHVVEHFPPPTRVWLDEPQCHEPEHHPSTEPEHQQSESVHHHHHQQQSPDNEHHDISVAVNYQENQANDYQEHQNHVQQEPETFNEEPYILPIDSPIPQKEPDQALFAIDKAIDPSMQNKLEEFIASLNSEDDDISDRDLIPINFKPTSRLQTGMYTPSPSGSRVNSRVNSRSGSRVNSRSGSRRASVSSSRRNSIAAANSPTRKLSLNTVSADVIIAHPTVTATYQVPQDADQSSKLFASASASVFRKTPYTSASATPALARTPDEYERHSYFYDDDEEDDDLAALEQNGSDFLYDHQYSLTDRLMAESAIVDWDPLSALNKLKEHSESMVLRQSLQEALVKTAQMQQEEEMVTAVDKKLLDVIKAEEAEAEKQAIATSDPLPSMKKKRPTAFKSSWDEEEYELPSALASGQSTPCTPIARRMSSSDLTKLLALEKEQFRQQRASLKMAKPQAAVASMLEAELDLSRGLLFQRRRHYVGDSDSENDETQASATLSIGSSEPRELLAGGEIDDDDDENQVFASPEQCAAYYDECVILEAQKRLRALVTGEKLEEDAESMSLPFPSQTRHEASTNINSKPTCTLYQYGETRSTDPQAFGLMYNSKSYRANFGFDENHKLQIYQSDLLPTDEGMEDIRTLSPETVVCKNNPVEKQKLAKEKEELEQKLEEKRRLENEKLKVVAASKEFVSEAAATNAEIPEAANTSRCATTQESTPSGSANLNNDTTNNLTKTQVCLAVDTEKKQNDATPITDNDNSYQIIDPSTNVKKNIIGKVSMAIQDTTSDSVGLKKVATLVTTVREADLEEMQGTATLTPIDEMKQEILQDTLNSDSNLIKADASFVSKTATIDTVIKSSIVETTDSKRIDTACASTTSTFRETGFDTFKSILPESALKSGTFEATTSITSHEPETHPIVCKDLVEPILELPSVAIAKPATVLEPAVTTTTKSVTITSKHPDISSRSDIKQSSSSCSTLTSQIFESSSTAIERTTTSSTSSTTKTSKLSTKAKRRNSRRKSTKSS